jgi:hypothetical protein
MAITIECPKCLRQLNVPETLLGRRVKCPMCGVEFEASASPPSVLPASPPPVEESDYVAADPPPQRRQRDPLDYDEDLGYAPERRRPHRGGLILTLGILGLVFSLCPLPGWVLGGCAMSMGNSDLYEMAKGRMDREGRGTTQAGRILGIIAVTVASLSFVGGCMIRLANMK